MTSSCKMSVFCLCGGCGLVIGIPNRGPVVKQMSDTSISWYHNTQCDLCWKCRIQWYIQMIIKTKLDCKSMVWVGSRILEHNYTHGISSQKWSEHYTKIPLTPFVRTVSKPIKSLILPRYCENCIVMKNTKYGRKTLVIPFVFKYKLCEYIKVLLDQKNWIVKPLFSSFSHAWPDYNTCFLTIERNREFRVITTIT